jgi:hypothetical protein
LALASVLALAWIVGGCWRLCAAPLRASLRSRRSRGERTCWMTFSCWLLHSAAVECGSSPSAPRNVDPTTWMWFASMYSTNSEFFMLFLPALLAKWSLFMLFTTPEIMAVSPALTTLMRSPLSSTMIVRGTCPCSPVASSSSCTVSRW